jgi:hypothetical protein
MMLAAMPKSPNPPPPICIDLIFRGFQRDESMKSIGQEEDYGVTRCFR